MEPKKLAQLCRDYAENKKAENVVVLDVRKLSSVTDFYVIASGSSAPHLRAIESEVFDRLQKEHGVQPKVMDGAAGQSWIVADFFDVIVHLMKAEWFFLPSVVAVTVAASIVVTIAVGFAGTWRALGQKAAFYLRNE